MSTLDLNRAEGSSVQLASQREACARGRFGVNCASAAACTASATRHPASTDPTADYATTALRRAYASAATRPPAATAAAAATATATPATSNSTSRSWWRSAHWRSQFLIN